MVAEKCEGGAEPRPECRRHLRRVRRDHRDLAVVDGKLILKRGEVPDLALALRSPVASVKAQDERELAGQLRKTDELVAVIGQLEVREAVTEGQLFMHG